MTQATEREFLSLAGTWLMCRYRVMGNQVSDLPHMPNDWPFALLGAHDNAAEMRMIIEAVSAPPDPCRSARSVPASPTVAACAATP